MSGGSGLWFVVCIPTQSYEREKALQNDSQPGTPGYQQNEQFSTNGETENNNRNENEVSLEQILRKTLDELRINDAIWVLEESGKFHKVTFPCHPGLRCDIVLTTLTTNGIGMCKGSTLGILPCSVLLQDSEFELDSFKEEFDTTKIISEDKKSESSNSTISKTKSDIKRAFRGFKEMQKKFLKTVTARLTVAQVVEGVRAGAEPTFDFIVCVVVASMIAALGLLENSSVVIVASMLISPIMGPILAGTFGAVIRDKPLRNLGIKTEILGLFLCVLFGFLIGLLGGCFNYLWGHRNWPTEEMISRGRDRSLWIGVLIALPSGVGVALSVLAGNAGCLVGVAISASLLPPTVNAGLLWGLSVIRSIRSRGEEERFMDVHGYPQFIKPSLVPNQGYTIEYFDEMDKEYAMLGLVSLGLALLNIACIFVAAVAVLKIKEVAPLQKLSRTVSSRFWQEDIKIAREYNTTMPPVDPEDLGSQFLAEWASLNGIEPDDVMSDDEEAAMTRYETLKDIIQDVEADEVYQTVTRSVVNRKDTRPIIRRLSVNPSTEFSDRMRGSGDPSEWLETGKVPELERPAIDLPEEHFEGVQLRRPNAEAPVRNQAARNSVAILRQSLANAENRYTLWPLANRTTVLPRQCPRNTMSPLIEESAFSIPIGRRSRFLEIPQIVIKETSC